MKKTKTTTPEGLSLLACTILAATKKTMILWSGSSLALRIVASRRGICSAIGTIANLVSMANTHTRNKGCWRSRACFLRGAERERKGAQTTAVLL